MICLVHEPWHGPWKLYQQVMSLLARSNRVLYVGPPRSLREAAHSLGRKTGGHPNLERVTDALAVYHEPVLYAKAGPTHPWSRPFNWITGRLRLRQVRRLAKREGMLAPILWIFDPMMASAVGTFGEKLLVYYVVDNYVEFIDPRATRLRAAVAANDGRLLARADLVFTVSESLRQRCAGRNPRTFLVPNGVDYDRFQTTIATHGLPRDMQGIPRPILGHVGVIQGDLDLALLERLATQYPQWSLVFVGPAELVTERPRFHALLARPNVYYLGSKPVKDVPLYINGCDVCLMPYSVTKPTVSDYDSIKLYEYLACGRPVVSTNVPSARRFSPLVRIATDGEEFVAQVKSSLEEDPGWADARRREASRHSWQRRVAALSETIVQMMGAHP